MGKLAIDKFKNDIRFRNKIAHIETIPSKKATYMKVDSLNNRISNFLEEEEIKLYKHQALSYKEIKENKNIIITTPTASGKTLAFNLPILERLIEDEEATAMYMYPAKALSNDQLNVLKNFDKKLKANIKPATYDGDTPNNKRYSIRQNSRIVLTNPYQLHHILSWHHQWKRFYTNLKYIVIDEAHYYKGIFGSNVAFLIRRLKRIVNSYGSNPQFILSSATLANPIELAEKLVDEKFSLIDEDTSPSGEKDFILYNPFYKNIKKNSKSTKGIGVTKGSGSVRVTELAKGTGNVKSDEVTKGSGSVKSDEVTKHVGSIENIETTKININEDLYIEDKIASLTDSINFNDLSNENNSDNGKIITNELSIHQETQLIFLYLLLKDIQTLCFTVSRKIAELIAMWAKKDMLNYKKKFADKITAYRAGYLPQERRAIEEGLKNRDFLGVTCTNALELGINIGSLDAVIISGYPGTMISTWQQAGRAGRKNQKAIVILLAFENQLDQYFMKNPEFFFDKTHENAIVDLNNDIIIKSHLLCAANELPIKIEEANDIFNLDKKEIDELVDKEELLKNPREQYIYPYDEQTSFRYSLDQLSNDSFKIIANNNRSYDNGSYDNGSYDNGSYDNGSYDNGSYDNGSYNNKNYDNKCYDNNKYFGKLLETMERSQVYREAHEGAVLINKGETYIVDRVNLKSKIVNVSKRSVDYHTIVLKNVDTKIKSKIKKIEIGNLMVNFGELEVTEDFYKYKKMHFSKSIASFFLDLPPLSFKTKGLWFTIPEKIKNKLEEKFPNEESVYSGGLHGVEHALISLFPLHVMCDRFDIGGLSTNYHADTQEATIFIYDAYEGGIGICEKAIEVFEKLVDSTKNLVEKCQCKEGCPSCIYSPKCGNENKPLHKNATITILNYINEEIKNKKDVLSEYYNGDNINNNEIVNINNKSSKIPSSFSKTPNSFSKTPSSFSKIPSSFSKVPSSFSRTANSFSKDNNNNKEENNVLIKLKEAKKLFKEKKYIFAKDILVDLLNEDKKNSNAWYLLGAILNAQGDSVGALKFLKKSLYIDPSNEEAYELFELIKFNNIKEI